MARCASPSRASRSIPTARDLPFAARYQETPNQPMAATATTATARIAVRNGPPREGRPGEMSVLAMLVMGIQSGKVEVMVTADGAAAHPPRRWSVSTAYEQGHRKITANQSAYWQAWLPSDPARAVVVIVHG